MAYPGLSLCLFSIFVGNNTFLLFNLLIGKANKLLLLSLLFVNNVVLVFVYICTFVYLYVYFLYVQGVWAKE